MKLILNIKIDSLLIKKNTGTWAIDSIVLLLGIWHSLIDLSDKTSREVSMN